MLKFNVRGQTLSRVDRFRPVEKSVNYLTAEFFFITEEWEKLHKTAICRNMRTGLEYDVLLTDDKCIIPWEAIDTDGSFEISVKGTGEGVTVTSSVENICIGRTLIGGTAANPPSPTVVEQILNEVDQISDEVGEISNEVNQVKNELDDKLDVDKLPSELSEAYNKVKPLYCNLKFTDERYGTCDKSFAEMEEAIKAGREVLLRDENKYWIRGFLIEDTSSIRASFVNSVQLYKYFVRSDDSVFREISKIPSVYNTTGTSVNDTMSQAAITKELNKKLGSDELPDAVNEALAQAKESGEFDGADGKNGSDGKDGYTPQKGIDYFDGKNGADGKDGITPHIGENGNWWIGTTDTGVRAAHEDYALLTDDVTNIKYKLYVSNGKLTLSEVE